VLARSTNDLLLDNKRDGGSLNRESRERYEENEIVADLALVGIPFAFFISFMSFVVQYLIIPACEISES
jgi:hypothetical protein